MLFLSALSGEWLENRLNAHFAFEIDNAFSVPQSMGFIVGIKKLRFLRKNIFSLKAAKGCDIARKTARKGCEE